MNKFYKWCLRKYLSTVKIRSDDVVVIALKEEATRKELDYFAELIKEDIPKSVIIAGVDKIIVA
ncbi:MAG TPA: hypothetical protein ENG48_11080 [Candidatus Atribacteria bacterium]|nr:hypothetical protein [Candidatus Atribacteria bacterium]